MDEVKRWFRESAGFTTRRWVWLALLAVPVIAYFAGKVL